MQSLIERLRVSHNDGLPGGCQGCHDALCEEAATELENMRKRLVLIRLHMARCLNLALAKDGAEFRQHLQEAYALAGSNEIVTIDLGDMHYDYRAAAELKLTTALRKE